MSNIVHSLKGLKRVQTPAGPRWYDTKKGMYAKYIPLAQVKRENPEGTKVFYRKKEFFEINIKEAKVTITEGSENNKIKFVKEFLSEAEATDFYKSTILAKIKIGYRNWKPIFEEKKEKENGKWGSKVISSSISNFWQKRDGSRKKKSIKKNNNKSFEVPFGYIEITKDSAEKIEKIIGHLAEFIKQGKRTKAIKDVRYLIKSKKIYSSIQYKLNYALDQYEEKGLLYAKACLKKGNKLSAHLKPGRDDFHYIVKFANLRRLINFTLMMLKILKGLLIYHDTRDPQLVKMLGRKNQGGPILLRPKKIHTLRFFNEGREVYSKSISILREFNTSHPRVARLLTQ